MTKPVDETWTRSTCGLMVDGTFVPWAFFDEDEEGNDSPRSTLALAAPAMARALRAICLRFDEQGNDGGESMGQELREQVDDALAAAGVDAPKMATWRMADAGPPQPVKVVARGKAGAR